MAEKTEKKEVKNLQDLSFVTQLSVVVKKDDGGLEPLVITIMRDSAGVYKLFFDVLSKNVLSPDKVEDR